MFTRYLTDGATAASATLPTSEELADLQEAIDSGYLESDSQPVYMVRPAMRIALPKAIDNDGRRLDPEIKNGQLQGFPLVVNVDMTTGADSIGVVFGSVARGVLVQQVAPIFVASRELAAEFYQTVYFLHHRMGCKLVDSSALVALKMHS